MTVPSSSRVPNRTLRAIRLALRMSQSEFAAAVRHAGDALGEPNTCNKRLVQKWESGEHGVCRPNYRRALQSVTRTPYEQLGFAGAPSVPVATGLIPAQRFTALTGLRPDGGAAPGEGGLDGGPGAVPGQRLRFALERPEQAGAEAVGLLEATTEHFFDLEHHQPARLLAPSVYRHVDDIAALLAGTRREPLRRRLAAAGGRAAALAGWIALDLGDFPAAHRNWDSALAAARYAADGPLLACVLTYMSYSASERGDPATAWQLAHTAVAHAGPDARARAWMASRAAEEAARLGERRAALGELELAIGLGGGLTAPGPDARAQPWTRFFDRSCLAASAANVHGRLGEAQQARDAAAWALRTLGSEQVKSRAVILAEAACAAARVGELELVGELATEAADLTERLEVTLARRKLRALMPMLTTYRGAPQVRELIARIGAE